MKQFFKTVFASMIGAFLSILLLMFIGILVLVGSIMSFSQDDKVQIKDHTIIQIQLNESISERSNESPFNISSIMNFNVENSFGLNDILASIKNASTDPNIDGIYLDISGVNAGLSTTEEIRNALIQFKKSNKFIYAYSEFYTQKGYYLASVADSIFLNPAGLLELKGVSAQYMFFQHAFEKLEITPEIIRVGSFKSAVEPFMADHMSDSNRLQTNVYLSSLFGHMIKNIAASRNLNEDSTLNIATKLKVRNAEDAVTYKLADALIYKDELLTKLMSKSSRSKMDDLRFITLKKYHKSMTGNVSISKNKIAVIYANGEIVGGEGDDNAMGSEKISRAIRKARMDDAVKSIVLRINSPGGSALASDVIWREVILAKKVKPVIVSMGDVAASGGYYIACAADTIVAEPTTITGSIGVFGVLFNAQKFFNNKLGITFDQVKIGEFADLGDYTKPMTAAERQIIQNEINRIYEDFTTKVAAGRKMPIDNVKRIAEGRVWSGVDALRIGLVDKLGNIDDAVKIAANKAKLTEFRIVNYPELEEPFQKLMKQLGGEIKTYLIPSEYKELAPYLKTLESMKNTKGIQARLPLNFQID
jgi:protease-4